MSISDPPQQMAAEGCNDGQHGPSDKWRGHVNDHATGSTLGRLAFDTPSTAVRIDHKYVLRRKHRAPEVVPVGAMAAHSDDGQGCHAMPGRLPRVVELNPLKPLRARHSRKQYAHGLALGGFGGLGGSLVRGLLPAPQRRLNPVRNARRQFIRPEGHGGGCDANCLGRRGVGSAQESDGFGFKHAPMLVHLPEFAQVDLHASLLKYAYMKTLQERTQEAIDAGFTVGQLGAAAGKTSAAASLWLNGTTKSIKADSALGLEKLTGWSATWWITGKGERGATRQSAEFNESPLQRALSVLGEALAREMPGEVRQDIADLLAKLAMRHGAERHQNELIALLTTNDSLVKITANSWGHDSSPNVVNSPSLRGNKDAKGGDEPWNTNRVNVAGPPKERRDHYPGKAKKPGKKQA